MAAYINIIGKKFNRLTALRLVPTPDHIVNKKCLYYEFECDCGNKKICIGIDVRFGHTKSCGCAAKDKIKTMIGIKFGKLMPKQEFIQNRKKHYLCECDCGYEIQVSKRSLTTGNVISCGCSKYHNMINNKFGKLLVIKRVKPPENKESKFYFLCLCDCGKEATILASQIRDLKRTSCGCGIKHTDSNEPYLASARNAYRTLYNDADISFEKFLYLSQQSCVYCGAYKSNMANSFKNRKNCTDFAKENGNFYYNGLDRIDSKLKHTLDNVVTCCRKCNIMKNNLSIEDFKKHIENIYNFYVRNKDDKDNIGNKQ